MCDKVPVKLIIIHQKGCFLLVNPDYLILVPAILKYHEITGMLLIRAVQILFLNPTKTNESELILFWKNKVNIHTNGYKCFWHTLVAVVNLQFSYSSFLIHFHILFQVTHLCNYCLLTTSNKWLLQLQQVTALTKRISFTSTVQTRLQM